MKAQLHAATNGRRCMCVLAVALGALAAGTTDAPAATWVVDRDRAQCANADFTAIQAAVDAAHPGDRIRVCPDLYTESITVDKPLTLKGDPDAVETVDCFDPTSSQPGDADATRQAIIDGTGSNAQELFNLRADDIVLAGFVLQGASSDPLPGDYRLYRRAIDTSDQYSGYRIHHNLIRLNTVGAQFGSNGRHGSRFRENCMRDNSWGLATDDRALADARVDHNATFRTRIISFEPTLGDVDDVTFDHNRSRQDGFAAYMIRNSSRSRIVANQVADAGVMAIRISGGHDGLVVRRNRLDGARGAGIFMDADVTSRDSEIAHNVINDASSTSIAIQGANERLQVVANHIERGGGAGILAPAAAVPRDPWATLTDSLITDNTIMAKAGSGISLLSGARNVVSGNLSSQNGASGIFLGANLTNSSVRENEVNYNARHGIAAALGSTGHVIEHNAMHSNGTNPNLIPRGVDARDDNNPLNAWIDNDCETDFPAGAICGTG